MEGIVQCSSRVTPGAFEYDRVGGFEDGIVWGERKLFYLWWDE